MLPEIALWIVKAVGGEQIKQLLNRRGLQAELRSLKKALRDSQERREELEGVARLMTRLARERDQHHAEVIRLRAENVALREQLARSG